MDNIDKVKYIVCCPLCDNPKCVKGTDRCEAEVWKREKEKEGKQNAENNIEFVLPDDSWDEVTEQLKEGD